MHTKRVTTIANRLSYVLKSKKIKQIDLCKQLDIPKGAMCHYIKGDYEPRQDRIEAIAKALNVSEAWLMGYDVPMDRQEYYSLSKENPPSAEPELTEGEREFLKLFRMLPEQEQRLYIEMLRARLNARTKGQAQS